MFSTEFIDPGGHRGDAMQALAQWRHPMAPSEARDVLYWASLVPFLLQFPFSSMLSLHVGILVGGGGPHIPPSATVLAAITITAASLEANTHPPLSVGVAALLSPQNHLCVCISRE